MMAEVTEAIARSGVNVTALNAFAINNEAIFRIVTSDNIKALNAIKAKNFEALEKDAVAVELENKVGMASDMAKRLKEAKVDLTYVYGSTADFGMSSMIVFNSNDNKKAVEVLNQ